MPFKIKYSPKLIIGLLIAIFFGIALFIRIYYPYDQVFVGDWIKYTGNDAYYQMRLVDNMAQNFPHITAFDPYLIYPGGATYGGIHFFNYLLAFVIWIFTLGSPTPHAVDMISVYFPVVLAGLTIIPAYFMGKALFNRWAGVIAAGMVAVLPGEFVGRSLLGGTDQHIAETLFTTVTAMFVIFAIRAGWQSQLTWSNIVKRNWKVLIKPLLYSLLAGIFLGIYLVTWAGALLFVFIIAVYFVVQFIIDHLKGQSTFYLGFTGFFIFLPALLIFLPAGGYSFQYVALVIALLLAPVLAAISSVIAWRKLKTYVYPATIVVIAAVLLLILNFAKPDLLDTMLAQFSIFNPGGPTGTTTIEMQPFLAPTGEATTQVAWGNFTTSFFLIKQWPIPGIAMIAVFFLVWFFTRQQGDANQRLSLRIANLIVLALAIVLLFSWSITDSTALLVLTALAALAFFVTLVLLTIKQDRDEKHLLFFFVWTLVILVATLTQRRFAYYLVVNIALLSSYLCWQFIRQVTYWRRNPQVPMTLAEQYKRSRLVGIVGGIIAFGVSFAITGTQYFFIPVFILGYLSILYGFWAWVRLKGKNDYMMLWAFIFPIGIPVLAFSADESVKVKAKHKTIEKTNPWLYRFNIATLIILVFLAVFYPNYEKSKVVASAASYAPPDAWEETVRWMKDNTPEPLGADDAYYGLYDSSYVYPDSAYGVTAWWDYGYWITRTAHRIPSVNPSQSPEPIKKVANLFLSQDDEQARNIIRQLDSSYIILDETMVTTKLWAVATWAGKAQSDYILTYYYPIEGKLQAVQVFDLNYYELLCVRLYNFDGKASTSEKPLVLTYEEKYQSGTKYRQITNAEEFDSYFTALDYVNNPENANSKMVIVGSTPYTNPIPIEAVTYYEPVFGSTNTVPTTTNSTTPEVKVFRYLGN